MAMLNWMRTIAVLVLGAAGAAAYAQAAAPRGEGTVVLMSGSAEVEVANDEAVAQFYLEVQDADLARAQSQVSQRVAEAVAQLKRADPQAAVESAGYGSYPVYQSGTPRKPVGWRVRQSVTLRTSDLAALPRTVATGQAQLALGSLQFRLSRVAREKVEAELIDRAIANLNGKIGAAARSLGVPRERVRLEELNFGVAPPIVPMMARAGADMMASAAPVAEPQFDAGRTLQQVTVSGKARMLPP